MRLVRNWLFLAACGALCLPLAAEEPIPGDPPLPADAKILPAGPIIPDGTVKDSLGTVTVRPVPDANEPEPACFKQVAYLRDHHDDIMAISYLREIVTGQTTSLQDHSRAIIELADCLEDHHQDAEALCWLKVWMSQFSARPEMGAVSYRVGQLYSRMGLPDLARDAFYLTLAHTVNQAQVQDQNDLQNYTKLTTATLWLMATNEYQSGNWQRASELFARYRKEAPAATPISLENSSYLEADCYYQLHQIDKAAALYGDTLEQHPFNPLGPLARLRMYHLDLLQHHPEKARDEMQALVWTVRTAFPKDEAYWQKQTAQLLLALNAKDGNILPPLVQTSSHLPPQGKTWQDLISHYDALVGYQLGSAQGKNADAANSSLKTNDHHGLLEDQDLAAVSRYMDVLLPPPQPAGSTE